MDAKTRREQWREQRESQDTRTAIHKRNISRRMRGHGDLVEALPDLVSHGVRLYELLDADRGYSGVIYATSRTEAVTLGRDEAAYPDWADDIVSARLHKP